MSHLFSELSKSSNVSNQSREDEGIEEEESANSSRSGSGDSTTEKESKLIESADDDRDTLPPNGDVDPLIAVVLGNADSSRTVMSSALQSEDGSEWGHHENQVLEAVQAATYTIGEQVFARFESVEAWPGRVEDNSNSLEYVGALQLVVFFYGLHERKVVNLRDIYLFEENKSLFSKLLKHRILNMALREAMSDPKVNERRIPFHKRPRCLLLRKSHSHVLLEERLRPITDSAQDASDEDDEAVLYGSQMFLSSDNLFGSLIMIASFTLLVYYTLWIVITPFTEYGEGKSLLGAWFPNPSLGLAYPVMGGTILTMSIVAFIGTVCYRPRAHVQPLVSAVSNTQQSGEQERYKCGEQERYRKMLEFHEAVCKRKSAIFIVLITTMITVTPLRIITVLVMAIGGYHFMRDLF